MQTPLAICRNRLEMLMEDENLSESQLEELMKTHQTLEHITKLNKSLLLLSKIENGQFTDTVQVEVNKLLRQYLEDYKEVYQYREIITSIEEEGVFYLTINETLAVVLLTNFVEECFCTQYGRWTHPDCHYSPQCDVLQYRGGTTAGCPAYF